MPDPIHSPTAPTKHTHPARSLATLAAGPLAALAVYVMFAPGEADADPISPQARATLAAAAWMAVWWIAEAIPLQATALLPLVLFPLAGIATLDAAAAPYARPEIFFFMGGMMLAAAMEHAGLPQRFAVVLLRLAGNSPARIIAALMTATALLSMWVNNTSTTVMMLPIALSVVRILADRQNALSPIQARHFALAATLGIAYAATIGGVGSLFGTAPNIILQATIRTNYNYHLSFAEYAAVGVPVMLILLPAAWVLLTRVVFRVPSSLGPGHAVLDDRLLETTPLSRHEKIVLGVFLLAATLWIFNTPVNRALESLMGRPRPLPEAGVAVLVVLLLFLIPVDLKERRFALSWKTASSIQWGVLVLLGGGFSLAAALRANGVSDQIAALFSQLHGLHPFLIILAAAACVTMVSEVVSNTAVASTFLPIAAAVSIPGLHPFALLFPVAIAASNAFMLPMATPPNALAYATGHPTTRDMRRAGVLLNLTAILTVSTYCTFIAPLVTTFPTLDHPAPEVPPRSVLE
ncbi:MAG: SLC13/DASS family transporter [Phycisphaeraceae bacterium]|nr:MAG: SLC13/DASS family transporter [Phycisphaeraceae bacterium]